jgi:hypothetical protein
MCLRCALRTGLGSSLCAQAWPSRTPAALERAVPGRVEAAALRAEEAEHAHLLLLEGRVGLELPRHAAHVRRACGLPRRHARPMRE